MRDSTQETASGLGQSGRDVALPGKALGLGAISSSPGPMLVRGIAGLLGIRSTARRPGPWVVVPHLDCIAAHIVTEGEFECLVITRKPIV